MRKIRWEGFLGLFVFMFAMICVGWSIEPFSSRLYEITDQIFWVILSAYMCIKAVGYIFPKEEEDE